MVFLKRGNIDNIKMMIVMVALALSPLSVSATPTLIGDEIYASLTFSTSYLNQETIDPGSATVGTGMEFKILSGSGHDLFTVDIGDSFIKMQIDKSSTMTAGFGRQLNITGIDWFLEPSLKIQDFSLEVGNDYEYWTGPTGIIEGDVTYTDHSLSFEWGDGSYWPRASWVKINLIPSSGGDDPPPSVPEPTTMLLFGTGIAGIAAVGRRRRK